MIIATLHDLNRKILQENSYENIVENLFILEHLEKVPLFNDLTNVLSPIDKETKDERDKKFAGVKGLGSVEMVNFLFSHPTCDPSESIPGPDNKGKQGT